MTINSKRPVATRAIDVMRLVDAESGNQLFPEARPASASVSETATFFKHPLETSVNRTDHVIFDPIEMTLSVLVSGANYKQTFSSIKSAFRASTQITVFTKTDAFENMYIQAMPRDEVPGRFDSVLVQLTLKETLFSTAVVSVIPSNLTNSNTKERGKQEARDANAAEDSEGSIISAIWR